MKLSTEACVAFERDINLFVDHELPHKNNRQLVAHLESCADCHDYMDDLRELASVHRAVGEESETALTELVDRHSLFASITRTLVEDKRGELARLFYELGKAYVLKGNEAASSSPQRSVLTVSSPVDIRTHTGRGRRLVREGVALCEANASTTDGRIAGEVRVSASLFQRSRRLFSSSARAGSSAFANGHRLLQEALTLRPDLDEARLYLGFHHLVTGRHDRARIEFRRVYRTGKDPVHKMMALQFLGNVYSTLGDYPRAIECYQEVVASGLADTEPRLFTAIVNLAVNCAKAGLGSRCVDLFTDLVTRFPAKVAQARDLLSRKEGFAALLQREADLHQTLRHRVPALFAA